MTHTVRIAAPWVEPLAMAEKLSRRPGALALLSRPDAGGRCFVAADPSEVRVDAEAEDLFEGFGCPPWDRRTVALFSYDAGARAATGPRPLAWPDRMMARYPALLVFDHATRTAWVEGDDRQAAERALAWLELASLDEPEEGDGSPPAATLEPEAGEAAYLQAVEDVIRRIGSGELFQANIAQAWRGALRPGREPFEVFLALARARASEFGACWRLGERALVSNSPELFLSMKPTSRRVEARPIKGTRPRGGSAAEDDVLARALAQSEKDRAENLMIVDLMRNDLARVCTPGSVTVERLFEVESHPTVHHLVSTVTGRLTEGLGPAELMAATFPPGSITGAPKHQAMKVIAAHEPPRGPWCGSLVLLNSDGALTASVLIRTASFEKDGEAWRFRAQAGAGIVADSEPESELAETEAKFRALREALAGD